MRELELEPGAILFEEGEPSETVGLVLEGEIEVVRRTGGREVVLGTVGVGEYVGEMGVIEGRRRSATARARGRTRLRLFDRAGFFEVVVRDPTRAYELLVRMSERLRRADERIVRLTRERAGPQAPRANLRLFAASEQAARQLPAEGVAITRLPFTVGRRPQPGERAPAMPVDLRLTDARPYRLSRRHFVIRQCPEGLELVDTSSTLGTAVDGVFLGEHFPRSRILLVPGEHEIVAGGVGSPWRFRLVVEAEADAAS